MKRIDYKKNDDTLHSGIVMDRIIVPVAVDKELLQEGYGEHGIHTVTEYIPVTAYLVKIDQTEHIDTVFPEQIIQAD